MRSGATSGLTPQQLLDRRRSQNKLAQRRFREKARLARSVGSSPSTRHVATSHARSPSASSSSPSDGADDQRAESLLISTPDSFNSSEHSDFPEPSQQPIAAISTGVPITSQIAPSSPLQASCEPLRWSHSDPSSFLPYENIPSIMPSGLPSYTQTEAIAHVSQQYVPDVPILQTSSVAPTYFELACASKSANKAGLSTVGMLADPFLTMQPMPSPSIFGGIGNGNLAQLSSPNGLQTSGMVEPSGRTAAGPVASESTPCDLRKAALSTTGSLGVDALFEYDMTKTLNNYPTEYATELSDTCNSASPALSSSHSETTHERASLSPKMVEGYMPPPTFGVHSEQEGTLWHASATSPSVSKTQAIWPTCSPGENVVLFSRSFGQVASPIAKAFEECFSRQQERKPFVRSSSPLLTQQLHFDKLMPKHASNLMGVGLAAVASEGDEMRTAGINDGRGFDAAMRWDGTPGTELPTAEQLLLPYRVYLYACIPWPSVKAQLQKLKMHSSASEEEFALDLLVSIVLPDQRPSFTIYGDDAQDPEAWELSESFAAKWWGLFDPSIVRRSNWWRRQRDLPAHRLPSAASTGWNDLQRQGLGTGCTLEARRLLSLAFPRL